MPSAAYRSMSSGSSGGDKQKRELELKCRVVEQVFKEWVGTMPRAQRLMGPRVKFDFTALKELSREERLRLLTRNAVEVGGRSEAEWGANFRADLAEAQKMRSGLDLSDK